MIYIWLEFILPSFIYLALNYYHSTKPKFWLPKYATIRSIILRGIALLMVTSVLQEIKQNRKFRLKKTWNTSSVKIFKKHKISSF